MAILLNSVSNTVYKSDSKEFSGVEQKRADIVTAGRVLMRERIGRDGKSLMAMSKTPFDFAPMLNDGAGGNSYSAMNKKLQKETLLFCAKMACKADGRIPPSTLEDFQRDQRNFFENGTFLVTLSGIVAETITPMLPVTMSTALDWLADFYSVPVGMTKEINIQSNDVFMFEDDSWGASRSKPVNTIYTKTVTLNPTLRTANGSIKWYQLAGNDADLGRFYNAFALGWYNKVMALWGSAMKAATNDTAIVPTNLKFTNTSANWVKAAEAVADVNGVRYRSVVGFGRPSALTKALPSGAVNASTVNLDAALATMIGAEWTRYGFLGEYMGINLFPIDGAIVPGTQNTTIEDIIPANQIILMPVGGRKPIAVGIEEGSLITVQMEPSKTGDGSIDVRVSGAIDAKPALANKIAVITV